jgi:hypothetical protein
MRIHSKKIVVNKIVGCNQQKQNKIVGYDQQNK